MFGNRAASETASSKYGSARWWMMKFMSGKSRAGPLEIERRERGQRLQPEREALVELDGP